MCMSIISGISSGFNSGLRITQQAVAAGFLLITMAACDSSNGVSTLAIPGIVPVAETPAGMIGAAGGAVSTAGGEVSLMIPAGALDSDQPITIAMLDASTSPNPLTESGSNLAAADFRIELLPNGLTFATPVSITVNLPGTSTAVSVGTYEGFSTSLRMAALVSADGTAEALVNPVVNIDPASGAVSMTAQFSHFSDVLIWDEFRVSGDTPPAKINFFGYQEKLQVGTNIAIVAEAVYEEGIFDQVQLNLTDESSGAFDLTSGDGTFLLPPGAHVGLYTCREIGTGEYRENIKVNVISTFTAPNPIDPDGEPVQGISFNGKVTASDFLVKDFTVVKPVDCIAAVTDNGSGSQDGSGQGGDGSSLNDGTARSTPIDEFTVTLLATEALVGETFTVMTEQNVNPLFISFAQLRLTVTAASGLPTASNADVKAVLGGGSGAVVPTDIEIIVTQTQLSQLWTFKCEQAGTLTFEDFQGTIEIISGDAPLRLVSLEFIHATPTPGTVTCVEPAPPEVSSNWNSSTDGSDTQLVGTSENNTLHVDAESLNGAPSDVRLTATEARIRFDTIFASLFGASSAAPRQTSRETGSATDELGVSITDGIHFDSTPTEPYVVTAVTHCLSEGIATLTANITDEAGGLLSSSSIDITCVRPPTSAACQNAASGLEKTLECNSDLPGVLPFADIFSATLVDVPIGGIGRSVPGGITLHLPATRSGAIINSTDFSSNGWNGGLAPPSPPVSGMFGLDSTHQYLFVQYESGVDLIDLTTPDAAPVFTGLLNYPGRAQEAEFNNFDDSAKLHDYFVMPVHRATGDYLIGCGTDVVRHDFDPLANSGAGAFVANAERISSGIEVCRDIWTSTDADGVAPGYAYATKSASSSQKTAHWLEDGVVEVTLGGDWATQNIAVNNRIMGGVGGLSGEHTLLASRGTNEKGLWSGIPGDAVEGSIAPRISTAALFQDVRCVGALCVATASDTLTTLSWPDRSVKPTVIENSFIVSLGLSARNMVVAANGNIYLAGVSSKRVTIARVSPEGEFGGIIKVDVSSVCNDPQSAQVMDMAHMGILCRTDNQLKVLEFVAEP